MPSTAPKLDAYATIRLFHKIVECSHGQEMDVVLNMIQEKQIPVAALKKLNKLDEYIEVEAIDKNHKAETVNYLTPLGFATKMGFQKKVKDLLDAGANPNLKEAYGMQYTPLQRAIADGNKSLVKIIMKANPNVNVVDQRGESPLAIAINQDDLGLVKMLIKAGAQVNKDLQGHSALVIAVDRYCDTTEDDGSIEIIKELLKTGAELKDASGFDVVEFAKAEGCTKVTEAIERLQKKKSSPNKTAKAKTPKTKGGKPFTMEQKVEFAKSHFKNGLLKIVPQNQQAQNKAILEIIESFERDNKLTEMMIEAQISPKTPKKIKNKHT